LVSNSTFTRSTGITQHRAPREEIFLKLFVSPVEVVDHLQDLGGGGTLPLGGGGRGRGGAAPLLPTTPFVR